MLLRHWVTLRPCYFFLCAGKPASSVVRQYFEIEKDRFGTEDMLRFVRMYRVSPNLFLISPNRVDFR